MGPIHIYVNELSRLRSVAFTPHFFYIMNNVFSLYMYISLLIAKIAALGVRKTTYDCRKIKASTTCHFLCELWPGVIIGRYFFKMMLRIFNYYMTFPGRVLCRFGDKNWFHKLCSFTLDLYFEVKGLYNYPCLTGATFMQNGQKCAYVSAKRWSPSVQSVIPYITLSYVLYDSVRK